MQKCMVVFADSWGKQSSQPAGRGRELSVDAFSVSWVNQESDSEVEMCSEPVVLCMAAELLCGCWSWAEHLVSQQGCQITTMFSFNNVLLIGTTKHACQGVGLCVGCEPRPSQEMAVLRTGACYQNVWRCADRKVWLIELTLWISGADWGWWLLAAVAVTSQILGAGLTCLQKSVPTNRCCEVFDSFAPFS